MFWLAEVFNGSYSEQEMKRAEQWARRQRAEMVRDVFSHIGHALVRGTAQAASVLGRGYAGFRRSRCRRAAIRELNGLSDHTLRDIGLERGDIPYTVEALLDGRPGSRTAADNVRPLATPRIESGEAGPRDDDQDWQRAA